MHTLVLVVGLWCISMGTVNASELIGTEMNCSARAEHLLDRIAKEIRPDVRRALSDEVFSIISSEDCRAARNDGEFRVESLVALIRSRDDYLVYNGARSLSLLGSFGKVAVPELEVAKEFYLSQIGRGEFFGPGTPLSAIENALFRLQQ